MNIRHCSPIYIYPPIHFRKIDENTKKILEVSSNLPPYCSGGMMPWYLDGCLFQKYLFSVFRQIYVLMAMEDIGTDRNKSFKTCLSNASKALTEMQIF